LVLPGGSVNQKKGETAQGRHPVFSFLRGRLSAKDQKDLRLGRDTGSSTVENEATKHDDAEVPIFLWNDRLARPWRSLEGPNDTVDTERDMTL
jgi:hypothetical protein